MVEIVRTMENQLGLDWREPTIKIEFWGADRLFIVKSSLLKYGEDKAYRFQMWVAMFEDQHEHLNARTWQFRMLILINQTESVLFLFLLPDLSTKGIQDRIFKVGS